MLHKSPLYALTLPHATFISEGIILQRCKSWRVESFLLISPNLVIWTIINLQLLDKSPATWSVRLTLHLCDIIVVLPAHSMHSIPCTRWIVWIYHWQINNLELPLKMSGMLQVRRILLQHILIFLIVQVTILFFNRHLRFQDKCVFKINLFCVFKINVFSR